MSDARVRIAMARQRFGQLRHLWYDKCLHLNLRLRLYKSCMYHHDLWVRGLDHYEETRRALNGAKVRVVSVITSKTLHQEASATSRTFNLVSWVRARRLQWLGHILRMETNLNLKHKADRV